MGSGFWTLLPFSPPFIRATVHVTNLELALVAFHVKKSGKSKKRPTLHQNVSRGIFFFSHNIFGVSISSDILPPTYFNTGWHVEFMKSASSRALWSIHSITFCSGSPANHKLARCGVTAHQLDNEREYYFYHFCSLSKEVRPCRRRPTNKWRRTRRLRPPTTALLLRLPAYTNTYITNYAFSPESFSQSRALGAVGFVRSMRPKSEHLNFQSKISTMSFLLIFSDNNQSYLYYFQISVV